MKHFIALVGLTLGLSGCGSEPYLTTLRTVVESGEVGNQEMWSCTQVPLVWGTSTHVGGLPEGAAYYERASFGAVAITVARDETHQGLNTSHGEPVGEVLGEVYLDLPFLESGDERELDVQLSDGLAHIYTYRGSDVCEMD